jgi:hypothetical protein
MRRYFSRLLPIWRYMATSSFSFVESDQESLSVENPEIG